MAELDGIKSDTSSHPRWLAVLLLGIAGACLAILLGADLGAVSAVGISTGMGLLARHTLAIRHFSVLTLPFVAALIGSLCGGIAIVLGLTRTPSLVMIVPALMLVPGPHLINAILDLLDNYLPMCLARLGLASGILLASALGIVLGAEITLSEPLPNHESASAGHVNLIADMLLAGIVTCGFAVFYNTSWRQVGLAAIGGMIGHGLRFLALHTGCRAEAATFLGGMAVGAIAGWIARSTRTPVAVVAFAGAVTMMPGMHIYRALGGALQLARFGKDAESSLVAETLGNLSQAGLEVAGLAIGLVLGARLVLKLTRRQYVSTQRQRTD